MFFILTVPAFNYKLVTHRRQFHIGGGMVIVLASFASDRGFDPRSGYILKTAKLVCNAPPLIMDH